MIFDPNTYDSAQFPIGKPQAGSDLYSSLGYFWRRVFQDRDILTGLTNAQANSAKQAYIELFEIINSYSAYDIPVFNIRNWYPLVITENDLDNNTLRFGEGAVFSESSGFLFGAHYTDAPWSMVAPAELKEITVGYDRILSPTVTWTNGGNINLVNGRIFFDINPLETVTPQAGPDGKQTTIWFYNAGVDENNLYQNLGYLFGLAVPHSDLGRNVLSAMTSVITEGPSIGNLQILCNACLLGLGGNSEVVDNLSIRNWWNSELVAGPDDGRLPLILSPQMFAVGYGSALKFVNEAQASVTFNGLPTLPVIGSPADVNKFNKAITQSSDMTDAITVATESNTINPVDFLFKNFLSGCTTLMRIKFTTPAQLALFETVIGILKNNLPKHVWLIILCEISFSNEEITFTGANTVDNVYIVNSTFPILLENGDSVSLNSGSGLLIQDMILTRTIPAGTSTLDFRNLNLTKPA